MELAQLNLDQILGAYFCRQYRININEYYKIEEVDAKELLVPERLDLIAKLKYIEYREKGYNLDYIKEVYTAHIEAFSNGSYTEPGNDSKNTINKYFNVFNNLIDTIKHSGLDNKISVIPVGKNNVILDGAHRVAIAAYFNLKVPIIRFENLYANYGVEFFQSRLLNQKYIDYLMTEYCKLKDNLYILCIWPDLDENRENRLIKRFNKNNEWRIIYRNKMKIGYKELQNLITSIDTNLEWKDEHNKGENYSTIYLLECNSFSKVLELKSNFQTTHINHFIHITTHPKETIDLANILLNSADQGNPNNYIELQSWIKRKIRNIKHNSRRNLILLTKKFGLYKKLRIFYHYVREFVR